MSVSEEELQSLLQRPALPQNSQQPRYVVRIFTLSIW
jgi:hypothetical protein